MDVRSFFIDDDDDDGGGTGGGSVPAGHHGSQAPPTSIRNFSVSRVWPLNAAAASDPNSPRHSVAERSHPSNGGSPEPGGGFASCRTALWSARTSRPSFHFFCLCVLRFVYRQANCCCCCCCWFVKLLLLLLLLVVAAVADAAAVLTYDIGITIML